jgi:hypothetical protein
VIALTVWHFGHVEASWDRHAAEARAARATPDAGVGQ